MTISSSSRLRIYNVCVSPARFAQHIYARVIVSARRHDRALGGVFVHHHPSARRRQRIQNARGANAKKSNNTSGSHRITILIIMHQGAAFCLYLNIRASSICLAHLFSIAITMRARPPQACNATVLCNVYILQRYAYTIITIVISSVCVCVCFLCVANHSSCWAHLIHIIARPQWRDASGARSRGAKVIEGCLGERWIVTFRGRMIDDRIAYYID